MAPKVLPDGPEGCGCIAAEQHDPHAVKICKDDVMALEMQPHLIDLLAEFAATLAVRQIVHGMTRQTSGALRQAYDCRSHFAKGMDDAGWGYSLAMLSYKAENAGKTVVDINPHNTSQVCFGCGFCVQHQFSEHLNVCPRCGLVLDRDHNAAMKVLGRGQRLIVKSSEVYASVGRGSPLRRGEDVTDSVTYPGETATCPSQFPTH
jgi:hypothetical protein